MDITDEVHELRQVYFPIGALIVRQEQLFYVVFVQIADAKERQGIPKLAVIEVARTISIKVFECTA